jgi:opacity protein-like surface antigen
MSNRTISGLLGAAFIVSASGVAFAADMAIKGQPAPPSPPAPSWTGFYIGGDIGGAWMSGPTKYSFANLGNAAFETCGACTAPYSSPTLSANFQIVRAGIGFGF